MKIARPTVVSLDFAQSRLFAYFKRARRVVRIQAGAIDCISETFALDVNGAGGDFAISHPKCAARVFAKRLPTVRLYAWSDEDVVSHNYKPDADETVLAGASPGAQTFAPPDCTHDVIGELSLHRHA